MLDTFRPFSTAHAIVILVFAACCTAAVAHGRAWRGTHALRRHERALAWSNLAVWILVQVWSLLPRNFVAISALPLHVCDLASPLATVAILRPDWRVARTILFYWGFGLCTQAFLTPDLKEGPAHVAFWAFWLPHAGIVGSAIYDLAARGYRPGWSDFRTATVVTLSYVFIMFGADAVFGCNYGYLGRSSPNQPSAVDFLGPWPARVGVMTAIGQALFVLMTLPFRPWRAIGNAKPLTVAQS